MYRPKDPKDEDHRDALLRILFLFAKLNPGITYVQGMNELLAPIYYVFARPDDRDKEKTKEWLPHAEADTFFCFSELMGELHDRFIKSLDKSSKGCV